MRPSGSRRKCATTLSTGFAPVLRRLAISRSDLLFYGSSPISGTAAACAGCESGGRGVCAVAVGIVGLRCGHRPDGSGRARLGWTSCPTRLARPSMAAGHPLPPGRRWALWDSCLRLRRAGGWEKKSLRPDRDGDLQVPGFDRSRGPTGGDSNGEPSFSLPTLPARPERRLKFKAPCAVLPGWARRAAQGGRAVSADRRRPNRKRTPRHGGARTVSRHKPPPTHARPFNKPLPSASRTSCSYPANGRRTFCFGGLSGRG